jgi:hypothetical protein
MARGPNAGLERGWRERLARWRQGDATVADFCDGEGVSVASFYAWRRRLHAATTPTTFVPVRVVTPPPPAALEVVLADGRAIRVPAGFDAQHLRAVVAALEAAAC